MRLLRFARPDRSIGWGLETDYGVQDLCEADQTLPTDLVSVIQEWEQLRPRIERLALRLGPTTTPLQPLCPLHRPQKVLCIGLNYRDHAAEAGMSVPTEPIVFCKMGNALCGPGEPIRLPPESQQVDYEAELVAVIGRQVRRVAPSEAEAAIFGYCIGNDISARDWQLGKPGKQWFLGKTFDGFAPLGPVVRTASSLGDPGELDISLKLNDRFMQSSNTREMVFSPAQLVSYLSQVMTLRPGDLIFTGTPPGVGMAQKPPRFLKPGDVMEVSIQGLGKLVNPCQADTID